MALRRQTLSSGELVAWYLWHFISFSGLENIPNPRLLWKTANRSVPRAQKKCSWQCRVFHNGIIIPRNSPLDVLLTEDPAVLKSSNQKNFRMGQTRTHHVTGIMMCPVHALDHIIYNILAGICGLDPSGKSPHYSCCAR